MTFFLMSEFCVVFYPIPDNFTYPMPFQFIIDINSKISICSDEVSDILSQKVYYFHLKYLIFSAGVFNTYHTLLQN